MSLKAAQKGSDSVIMGSKAQRLRQLGTVIDQKPIVCNNHESVNSTKAGAIAS